MLTLHITMMYEQKKNNKKNKHYFCGVRENCWVPNIGSLQFFACDAYAASLEYSKKKRKICDRVLRQKEKKAHII